MLVWIGQPVVEGLRGVAQCVGLLLGAARRLVTPSFWRRTTRRALAEQVVLIAGHQLRFTAIVAVVTGVAVVLQAQVWLAKVGQSNLLGPFLAGVLVREIAPLITAFILIGRSGAAMVAELWTMRARGEVHALEAQGVDAFDFLVVPRVAAMTFAGPAMTFAFVLIAVTAGYLVGFSTGATRLTFLGFVDDMLDDLAMRDVGAAFIKSVVPAAMTAAVACLEAMPMSPTTNDLPAAVQRSYARSVLALVAVFGLTTVWIYLR